MTENPLGASTDFQVASEKRTLLVDECIYAVGTLGCFSYIIYDLPRLGDEHNNFIFFFRLGSYVVAVLSTYNFGSQFVKNLIKLHNIQASDTQKNTPPSSDQV